MELLQLEPPDHGAHTTGLYIVDDDGINICAGPFDSETAAIGWIVRRQNYQACRREAAAHLVSEPTTTPIAGGIAITH